MPTWFRVRRWLEGLLFLGLDGVALVIHHGSGGPHPAAATAAQDAGVPHCTGEHAAVSHCSAGVTAHWRVYAVVAVVRPGHGHELSRAGNILTKFAVRRRREI